MCKKRSYLIISLAALFIFMAVPKYTLAKTIYFSDKGSPKATGKALNAIVQGDEEKTINITSNIRINAIIRPGSNTTINAGNHKIIMTNSKKGILANKPNKLNYESLKNVTINGGIWYTAGNKSKQQTMMRITHASDIHFNNVAITDGYEDHAVELIACRNVTFNNCNFTATGKCKAACVEEQLQIDLADKYTAPGVRRETGSAMVNGAPSYNIFVNNCVVSGARGICANFASKNKKNRQARNYHSGIYINRCKITGKSSEALALFNTKSATVSNCDITTLAKPGRGSYSNGLHVVYIKGTGPAADTGNKIILKDNIVRGGKYGIAVMTQNKSKLGTVTISGNNVYVKSGINNAIAASSNVAQIVSVDNNQTYEWK